MPNATTSEAVLYSGTGGLLCKGGLLSQTGIGDSYVVTWAVVTLVTLVLIMLTSGPMFYYYYWPSQVTYEKWTRKSNPNFPSPVKVRDEIVQMLKGLSAAALCPAMSLWLAARGTGTQTFCGWGGYSLSYHVGMFFFTWFVSDFFEFYYHYLGHKYHWFWVQHKEHHKFFNPSPFAVIADEFFDQFCRSSPLVILPLLLPVNMDVLFIQYGLFFYAYGVYLHWGYESDLISAHNSVINTSFQHYLHHAKAVNQRPYHCGFMFKIWDNLFDSVWKKECFCAMCARKAGKRTREQLETRDIPDYSVLFQPSFWLKDGVFALLSGKASSDLNDLISDKDGAFLRKGKKAE
jgi:lathosterol oxidase